MKPTEIIIDTIKNLYNNGLVRILTLVILIIVFLMIWSTNANPETNRFGKIYYPVNIPGSANISTAVKADFKLDNNLSLPDSTVIYLASGAQEEEITKRLVQISTTLGLTSRPEILTYNDKKIFKIASGSASLLGSLTSGSFAYSGEGVKILEQKGEEEIKKTVFNFLVNAGLDKNVVNNPTLAYYDLAGEELIATKYKDTAKSVGVSYKTAVNNVPVIYPENNGDPLIINIDLTGGKITKLSYSYPNTNLTVKGNYELLSLNSIKKTPINLYRVFYLNYGDGNQSSGILPTEVKTVIFTNIFLAYLSFVDNQGVLLPVFVLEGKVITNENREGVIRAYLPAVKNQYSFTPAP